MGHFRTVYRKKRPMCRELIEGTGAELKCAVIWKLCTEQDWFNTLHRPFFNCMKIKSNDRKLDVQLAEKTGP